MLELLNECAKNGDYTTFVERIGVEKIIPLLPFSKEEIKGALESGDEYLNTLPLSKWDSAAGFRQAGSNILEYSPNPLKRLLLNNGIKGASPATRVCILKTAARLSARK